MQHVQGESNRVRQEKRMKRKDKNKAVTKHREGGITIQVRKHREGGRDYLPNSCSTLHSLYCLPSR